MRFEDAMSSQIRIRVSTEEKRRLLTPAREGFNNSNTANRLLPQLARYGTAIMGALAGGGGLYGGLEPLSAVGVSALTAGALKGAAAKASRAARATSRPIPINPSGAGGAAIRGGGCPRSKGESRWGLSRGARLRRSYQPKRRKVQTHVRR